MTRAALLAATLLAGCRMGAMISGHPDAARVEIGQDVFHVLIEGDRATVNNFATGIDNQQRLREGARAAIATQTDCPIVDLFKLDDMNFYQARLDCPAAS